MTVTCPLICIVAGEPSGDVLGARLMAALKEMTGGNIRFMGVGGESMAAEGLVSLIDQSDLAVMGFVEVLPRIPRVLSHLSDLTKCIKREAPVALLTIDSWGFNGALQKRVAKACPSVKRIHYVAPMVWVWKEGRAKSVARTVEHLLCLFPYEPPYFERYGLCCTHVGHPLASMCRSGDRDFKQRHSIAEADLLLCLLPGSRQGEVARLLPVLKDVVVHLAARFPNLFFVLPVIATVEAHVQREVSTWPVRVVCVSGERERYAAFSASSAAVAASGSVTLELARFGVPHCVIYKVSSITAWLFKRLRRMSFVNLVNIALDRQVVPELLQGECTAGRIVPHVESFLFDDAVRGEQQACFGRALLALAGGRHTSAVHAAHSVLDCIGLSPIAEERCHNAPAVSACDDPCP